MHRLSIGRLNRRRDLGCPDYLTIGKPHKDANGIVRNVVLIGYDITGG